MCGKRQRHYGVRVLLGRDVFRERGPDSKRIESHMRHTDTRTERSVRRQDVFGAFLSQRSKATAAGNLADDPAQHCNRHHHHHHLLPQRCKERQRGSLTRPRRTRFCGRKTHAQHHILTTQPYGIIIWMRMSVCVRICTCSCCLCARLCHAESSHF